MSLIFWWIRLLSLVVFKYCSIVCTVWSLITWRVILRSWIISRCLVCPSRIWLGLIVTACFISASWAITWCVSNSSVRIIQCRLPCRFVYHWGIRSRTIASCGWVIRDGLVRCTNIRASSRISVIQRLRGVSCCISVSLNTSSDIASLISLSCWIVNGSIVCSIILIGWVMFRSLIRRAHCAIGSIRILCWIIYYSTIWVCSISWCFIVGSWIGISLISRS